MFRPVDTMARLSWNIVETAAAAGAPDIVVFNDQDYATIKVAHVVDRCPYIIGSYATLEAANDWFTADFRALTAVTLDRRPEGRWYNAAVLMLMHLDLAPRFKSRMLHGAARGTAYTLVYIDNVWRMTTASGIWMKVNAQIL